jgi:hypothetical protein
MKQFEFMTWREKAAHIKQEMMITGVNPVSFFQPANAKTLEEIREDVARWREENGAWIGISRKRK